jgi:hypothetical protein
MKELSGQPWAPLVYMGFGLWVVAVFWVLAELARESGSGRCRDTWMRCVQYRRVVAGVAVIHLGVCFY